MFKIWVRCEIFMEEIQVSSMKRSYRSFYHWACAKLCRVWCHRLSLVRVPAGFGVNLLHVTTRNRVVNPKKEKRCFSPDRIWIEIIKKGLMRRSMCVTLSLRQRFICRLELISGFQVILYGLSNIRFLSIQKNKVFIYEVPHGLFNSRSIPSKASHTFGSFTTQMSHID